jgi:hypothetical protein
MGTSSSRTGDNAPRGGAWGDAKRGITGILQRGDRSYPKTVGSFIQAIGGPGAVGHGGNLCSAITTGQALGGFFSSITNVGLDETLKKSGLSDLIGKTPYAVISGIIDLIAGDGSLLDEAVIRLALTETLPVIFDESAKDYDELKELWENEITEDTIVRLLAIFVSEVIFERFLADLCSHIESKAITVSSAEVFEEEIKRYIEESVEFDLMSIDPFDFDWTGTEGRTLIERNFKDALEILRSY